MGYGAYSHDRHTQRTTARAKAGSEQIFTQKSCHPLMDPHGLTVRQSRDSAEHPESLALIFALDVTGSMGGIPRQLASESLPHFVKMLLDGGIPHPQVLFCAVGDAACDRAPFQVGQFESSDELMDQWLTRVWIESGGGGNGWESYELPMYFAARKTSVDCWERRQKKGYFLLTGDEPLPPQVDPAHIARIFGDDLEAPIPIEHLVRELRQQWEPFVIIPHATRVGHATCEQWRELFGDRVVLLKNGSLTALVAACLVALNEGAASDLSVLADQLRRDGQTEATIHEVLAAVTPFAESIGRAQTPAAPSSSAPRDTLDD